MDKESEGGVEWSSVIVVFRHECPGNVGARLGGIGHWEPKQEPGPRCKFGFLLHLGLELGLGVWLDRYKAWVGSKLGLGL